MTGHELIIGQLIIDSGLWLVRMLYHTDVGREVVSWTNTNMEVHTDGA